jgi:phage terminase large subunit-like protein
MKAIGFSPHNKQREIIDGILNDDAKYHVVSVGRQFGKSLMGINLVLYWAINNRPCKIIWVSPTYSQANKVQKEINDALRHSRFIESCNFSESTIRLRNGSEIYFRSGERYDNIRGFTFDYGVVDEAAFMRREVWFEALRPTFSIRGKKVLFLSHPQRVEIGFTIYLN